MLTSLRTILLLVRKKQYLCTWLAFSTDFCTHRVVCLQSGNYAMIFRQILVLWRHIWLVINQDKQIG